MPWNIAQHGSLDAIFLVSKRVGEACCGVDVACVDLWVLVILQGFQTQELKTISCCRRSRREPALPFCVVELQKHRPVCLFDFDGLVDVQDLMCSVGWQFAFCNIGIIDNSNAMEYLTSW